MRGCFDIQRRILPAWCLCFVLGLCLPVAATAQDSDVGIQGAGGGLRPAGAEWRSVGRLDMGQRGFCTVTLIAPDFVLTAAHCLTDGATGAPLAVADLRVRLGLRDDRAEVTRRVRQVVAPSRLPGGAGAEPSVSQVPSDVAVLELDAPVRSAQVPAVALTSARRGEGVTEGQVLSVVSFAQGRSRTAAVQDDCIVIERQASGALMLDCNVDPGSSGAPVIAMRPDGPRVVAVISARAELALEGFPLASVALAAPLDSGLAHGLFQHIHRLADDGGQGVATGAAGGAGSVRIRRPEGAAGEPTGPAARFVRPPAPTTVAPVLMR